jgi:quinol monooxygenase YgiN
MRVTVVARRTAYAGQEAALLAAMEQRIAQATPQLGAMQTASLFQGMTTPTEVLYIGDWESREAHQARVQENRVDELLAPLCSGACVRYYLRRWVAYESPQTEVGALDCAIIESRPERHEMVQAFLLREAAARFRAHPGFRYRRIYQDLDNPHRLVIIHGWQSPAAMQDFLRELMPSLDAALQPMGVTTATFVGVIRAELKAHPGNPS